MKSCHCSEVTHTFYSILEKHYQKMGDTLTVMPSYA